MVITFVLKLINYTIYLALINYRQIDWQILYCFLSREINDSLIYVHPDDALHFECTLQFIERRDKIVSLLHHNILLTSVSYVSIHSLTHS